MRTLTSLDKDTIADIMTNQDQIKARQAEVKEAIKALAERLETKPARVNSIIRLVRKEQSEPGTIEFEQDTLDAATKVAR